jgi:hypothetical protein
MEFSLKAGNHQVGDLLEVGNLSLKGCVGALADSEPD